MLPKGSLGKKSGIKFYQTQAAHITAGLKVRFSTPVTIALISMWSGEEAIRQPLFMTALSPL
jgi:hypothetical protein